TAAVSHAAAMDLTAGLLVLWTQTEPTAEVLRGRKTTYVWPHFTQQHQGRLRINSLKHRQIDSRHPVQRPLKVKARLIRALATPPWPPRACPALTLIREGAQVLFQLIITLAQLLPIELV